VKIKLYRSATVEIIDENFKLLTNPWLANGSIGLIYTLKKILK